MVPSVKKKVDYYKEGYWDTWLYKRVFTDSVVNDDKWFYTDSNQTDTLHQIWIALFTHSNTIVIDVNFSYR